MIFWIFKDCLLLLEDDEFDLLEFEFELFVEFDMIISSRFI